MDHTLCHKSNFSKLKKKIEIILIIFSDHSVMRREIYYKKTLQEEQKHVEAKQYAAKQPVFTEEVKGKLENAYR